MSHKPRVLVADDDTILLQTVADDLEAWGADVVRAETGDELLSQLADSGPFALVVTDIAMPWMSGLQVMQSSRYAGLDTPTIVMTALDDADIPRQVEDLGRDVSFLRKPFELETLESEAERLLRRR